MKVVVSDTSCISNLIVIEHLSLLQSIYHQIIVPPKVHEEVSVLKKFGYNISSYENASWINLITPEDAFLIPIRKYNLDEGETEAIALAQQINADVLLLDELAGRKVANQLGIETTGLLGVIAKAKREKLISSAKDIFDLLLTKARFRVSAELYTKVLTELNEI
jgi:predicted nucleic acid-binding protein